MKLRQCRNKTAKSMVLDFKIENLIFKFEVMMRYTSEK